MIRKEFKLPGPQRSLQILDLILGNLKFLTRLNEDQRKALYEHATLETFPAQHAIFEQGDIGAKMYIILKGRVAC